MNTKKTCVVKRLEYMLKYANHSRLNSWHDWGDLCDHLTSRRIFTLILNKIFHKKGKWLWEWFGFANHLSLNVCIISCKKWVQRERYPNKTHPPYVPWIPLPRSLKLFFFLTENCWQISRAALSPDTSFIARPAASWLDDFLVWLSPNAFGCCRKFPEGNYCPPDDQVWFGWSNCIMFSIGIRISMKFLWMFKQMVPV